MTELPKITATQGVHGVMKIVVRGWPCEVLVETFDNSALRLVAHRRADDEKWTFKNHGSWLEIVPSTLGTPMARLSKGPQGQEVKMLLQIPRRRRELATRVEVRAD